MVLPDLWAFILLIGVRARAVKEDGRGRESTDGGQFVLSALFTVSHCLQPALRKVHTDGYVFVCVCACTRTHAR